MKSGILSVVGLVAVSACIGCKAGKGFDVLMDINPLNRPMGQIRIQPVPEEEPRIARNTGVEVRFNLKRNGGTVGNEDINIDIRIPGESNSQPGQSAEPVKKVQEIPELLPVPALLTAQR